MEVVCEKAEIEKGAGRQFNEKGGGQTAAVSEKKEGNVITNALGAGLCAG